jgi:hypothetical protein
MKDVRFIWGLPQEDSFMKLKELVTSASVLVLPNDDLPFRLEADGSGITTGAVLSQQQVDDNAWHPIAFLSKALNPVEQNYEIHDTGYHPRTRGVEALSGRCQTPCGDLDRPQELGVFPSGPEVKLSTS